MSKITNTAEGPRGVETDAGTVFVDPGETVEVDVKKGHQLYEGLVEGGAKKASAASGEPKPLAAMNKSELLDAAAAAGVTTALDGDSKEVPVAEATNKQIAAAVEKARAAE